MKNTQQPPKIQIPQELIYYCQDCEAIIDIRPTTFKMFCPTNKEHKRITFGTEKSVKNFYKIKDEKFEAERLEREKIALRADKL